MHPQLEHKVEFKTDCEMMQFITQPKHMIELRKTYPPSTYSAQINMANKTVLVFRK